MATKTIEFKFRIGDTLTDVTSAVLRDPTNTFGVRRADNNAIIVASGTALTRVSVGVYRYQFTEPASGLSYEYWLEYTYLGNTRRERQVLQGSRRGIAGSVPIAPSAYVTMGIQTVSCGDSDLETFLSVHAATVWAMQARRGTVLDLRFQYFVLDLINLALDHVRMLIDTEIQNQQTQGTGYNNATNTLAASSASMRNRTALSTQSAIGSQTSARSASRVSSSQMAATSSQTSSRTGSGTDDSTQTQTSKTTRTSSQHLETVTTPVHGLVSHAEDYRRTDSTITNKMEMREDVKRFSTGIAALGTLSGQVGFLDDNAARAKAKETYNAGVGNTSSIDFLSQDSGSSYTNSGQAISGKGKNASGVLTGGGGGSLVTDLTTIGTGSRTNDIQRSSSSTMTGSASQTSSGTMTSASDDEAQRVNSSLAHSESEGHSATNSSSVAHRESVGASSMQASGLLTKNYYDQIFQSLKLMRENTVSQIEQLSQQVHMTTRIIIQKLSVTKPQAGLVVQAAARTSISQNPSGLGLLNTGFDVRTVR